MKHKGEPRSQCLLYFGKTLHDHWMRSVPIGDWETLRPLCFPWQQSKINSAVLKLSREKVSIDHLETENNEMSRSSWLLCSSNSQCSLLKLSISWEPALLEALPIYLSIEILFARRYTTCSSSPSVRFTPSKLGMYLKISTRPSS